MVPRGWASGSSRDPCGEMGFTKCLKHSWQEGAALRGGPKVVPRPGDWMISNYPTHNCQWMLSRMTKPPCVSSMFSEGRSRPDFPLLPNSTPPDHGPDLPVNGQDSGPEVRDWGLWLGKGSGCANSECRAVTLEKEAPF